MIGKILSSRYKITELIGTGGTANVYKAIDLKTDSIVALKVLKDEHRTDIDFVRRFEREAQAVLMLDHDNIVRLFDIGEDVNGISFIVLEYVEGVTLKDIVKNHGLLSPKNAIAYLEQILDALAHAHERGIIHRDVKPQNVIITPKGKVKLTDFGIARDAASTTRTFAGTNVIGSVHYISPEQARGDNVTAASDLYSCAIMLYELVTGEVPFAGDNSVAIALKHLQEEIIPPININTKLPRSLSDIIVKGACKNPTIRYQTARQMKADLHKSLREPNGTFARLLDHKDTNKPQRGAYSFGIMNIALLVVFVLGLFTAMFFIAKSIKDAESGQTIEYIVPTIVGKLEDDGASIANLRGFSMQVYEYLPSEEVAEGYIISQNPAAGTKGTEGDVITVTISSGSEYEKVPNLVGSILTEAYDIITNYELSINPPEYVESDLPGGQIIRQEPAPGTLTFAGDKIDIWVSSVPDDFLQMPNLQNGSMYMEDAIEVLLENGFTRVLVRYESQQGVMDGMVVKQNPAADLNVPSTLTAEIWVAKNYKGSYEADIAYNVDILEDEQTVIVTAKQKNGIEEVLLETTLKKGKQQAVSFTAFMLVGGDYECIIYIDGVEYKRSVHKFQMR